MTRFVSDNLRKPFNNLPPIAHFTSVDMEGPVLAAEIIALLLEKRNGAACFNECVELLCRYFHGRGGATPTRSDLNEASRLKKALEKWNECLGAKKAVPENSLLKSTFAVYQAVATLVLTSDPDVDWVAVRAILDTGAL